MKKLLALALCLVLTIAPIATIGVFADNAEGFTKDESTKTYTVTTADGLLAVAAAINLGDVDYNIVLAADIDLAGKTWTPIGTSTLAYKGTFDGKNFTISNLTKIVDYQTVGAAGYAGLIGKATEGCTVKNVKFTGASIMGVEFTGLVIGETAQANAEDTESKVTIENVHIRNSDIKGSNGWGTAPTSVNKNEYTGALIGKAGSYYTEVNNCSVVANITSECRTAGLIGGESVGSSITTCGVTINNCVVGGAVSQAKVANGSNTIKSGGASGLFGYHSTFPLTINNCVVAATLSSESNLNGAISFQTNKLTLNAINVVMTEVAYDKVNDVSSGTTEMRNVAIYKLDATDTTLAIAKNLNGKDTSPVKIDGADTTWADAKVTVINSREALRTKLSTIFANNEIITQEVLDDVVGHDHSFTNEVVDAKFLKAAATCTEAATYYKSCSCGIASSDATFTDGEPLPHNPSDKWTNDDNTHWHVCTTCLEAKSDEAEHTYGEWVVTKEATEARQGERTKTCTVCGHAVTEKTDKLAKDTTTATDNNTAVEESGCASMVGGMGIVAIVATLGMGLTVLKKRG